MSERNPYGGPVMPVSVCKECDRKDKRIAELESAVKEIDQLIDESDGVYGMCPGGKPLPWSELRDGGRLVSLAKVLTKLREKE